MKRAGEITLFYYENLYFDHLGPFGSFMKKFAGNATTAKYLPGMIWSYCGHLQDCQGIQVPRLSTGN